MIIFHKIANIFYTFVINIDSFSFSFDMQNKLSYLAISTADNDWGMAITTIGQQTVEPKEVYPVQFHPKPYNFDPSKGRILNEYQLLYITKGEGVFCSSSCKERKIETGAIILLFPGEWHTYTPSKTTGWTEYWVGFKGSIIESMIDGRFFSKSDPVINIGISATISSLYDEMVSLSTRQKAGYQQLLAGIVVHILGLVTYKKRNRSFTNAFIVNKINEARIIMKDNIYKDITAENISAELGMGYSWFRRMFKEYTGTSPANYMLQLKLFHAKELLVSTELSISEIAYKLKFENSGHFATFFKKKEGLSPTAFRCIAK